MKLEMAKTYRHPAYGTIIVGNNEFYFGGRHYCIEVFLRENGERLPTSHPAVASLKAATALPGWEVV